MAIEMFAGVAIILGLIISIVHYYSDQISSSLSDLQELKFMSFGAGISITYIFLSLFPELFQAVIDYRLITFLFLLVGFSAIHLVEKHIYKVSNLKLAKEMEEAHSVAFFVYYLIIGIVLFTILRFNIFYGILFSIPIMFHASISSISMKKVHKNVKEKLIFKLLLAFSTVIGVVIAIFVNIGSLFYNATLGFVIGALLYISVRDMIPEKAEGEQIYFVLGVVIYALFIIGIFYLL